MKPTHTILSQELIMRFAHDVNAFRLFAYIVDRAEFKDNTEGTFRESLRSVADNLGMTYKATRVAISNLVNFGIAEIVKGANKGANKTFITIYNSSDCEIIFKLKGAIKGAIEDGRGAIKGAISTIVSNCDTDSCGAAGNTEGRNQGRNDEFSQEKENDKEIPPNNNIINKDIITPKEIDKEKEITHITRATKRFVKPTIEDIKNYLAIKGYDDIDAEYFYNYNEAVGWIVGKTKKPMKDWHKAIALWHGNNQKKQATNGTIRQLSANERKEAELTKFVKGY